MKKLLTQNIFKKAMAFLLSLGMLVYLIPDINFNVHAENLTNDNIPDVCSVNENISLLANDIFIEQDATMFDPNNGHSYGMSSITALEGSSANAEIYSNYETFTYNVYTSYISGNDYGFKFKASQPGKYKFTATLMDGNTGEIASVHEITITVSNTA